VQARTHCRTAARRTLRCARFTLIFTLLSAGCSNWDYQDRARSPLKPMHSVVGKKSENFDVPPKVLEGLRPDYPEPEGEHREKGFVSLICTIDARGRLTAVGIESATSGSFAYEAIRAVTKWKFAPAIKDGHPVEGKLRVPLHFNVF
jgi:TonB family protein